MMTRKTQPSAATTITVVFDEVVAVTAVIFENREFQMNLYHAVKCVIKVIIIQFLLCYYYTVA